MAPSLPQNLQRAIIGAAAALFTSAMLLGISLVELDGVNGTRHLGDAVRARFTAVSQMVVLALLADVWRQLRPVLRACRNGIGPLGRPRDLDGATPPAAPVVLTDDESARLATAMRRTRTAWWAIMANMVLLALGELLMPRVIG